MPVDPTLPHAAQIIAQLGPRLPADAALRTLFAERNRLTPEDKRTIARAVFATCRWQGWLDNSAAPEKRITAAVALQQRFERDPASFKASALADRALPAWVAAAADFSAADLRTLQREPTLWIRTRAADHAAVVAELGHVEPAPAPAERTGLRYTGTTDLFRTAGFHEGRFEIQDLGSQLVGHACAPQPGETWWDTCAGEGGKTVHLGDLMQGKGLVWASDRHERRLARLKQRTARAQVFNYRAALWDGGPKLPTKAKFDGILVDAPCSGLGTWRRNPHARWTVSPTDVAELAVVQRQLLDQVAGSLKPGGRLIYAVCTLTHAETTVLADAFTAAHPELTPLPLLERGPQVFIRPGEWDANGMFLAGWTKQ